MNSICILFGKKETWDEARKLLGNVNSFIDALQCFDKENATVANCKKARQNVADLSVERVQKVSTSLAGLYEWVVMLTTFVLEKHGEPIPQAPEAPVSKEAPAKPTSAKPKRKASPVKREESKTFEPVITSAEKKKAPAKKGKKKTSPAKGE